MHRMEPTIILTKDRSLKKELSPLLPKNFISMTEVVESRDARIFIDIDTMGIGLIRELSESHLVIAVTKRRDTDPVIEATAAGAYEVLHWPLERDKVALMLQELGDCVDEMRSLAAPTGPSRAPTSAIVGCSPLIM